MFNKKKTEDKEDKDLRLLEEWLPKLDKGEREYLKGAAEALFYAQEAGPTISDSVEQDEKGEENNEKETINKEQRANSKSKS